MAETKAELIEKVAELETRCEILETELDAKHKLYIQTYDLYNKSQDKIGKIMVILRGDK